MTFLSGVANSFSYRNFCTTRAVFNGKSRIYAKREGRVMEKLLNGRKCRSSDRKFYPDIGLPTPGSTNFFDFIGKPSASSKSQRRLVILNKMLMRNISDILSTGELSTALIGKGLHLSKVSLTPTLNEVKVHWLANGDDKHDNEISDELTRIAPALRHSISQLYLMGSIPKIEFIKDNKYIKFLAVESLLKKADFGEDFVPTPLANDWKSENVIEKTLPGHIKEKIKEAESNFSVPEEPLPAMHMGVLGLNHDNIMKRVKAAVEKMKANHRKNTHTINLSNADESSIEDRLSTEKQMSYQERKKLFNNYLRERHIAWKKAHKKEKSVLIERAMHEKEFEKSLEKEFMADVYNYDEDEFDLEREQFELEYKDEIENKNY